MTPYYEQDGITIYHGDAADVLPSIGFLGVAVVSDPQYGIGFDTTTKRARKSGLTWGRGAAQVERNPDWVPLQHGDAVAFDPAPLLVFQELILWGANNYADRLPASRGWLVWDKLGDKAPTAFGDCELAWCSRDMSIRIWRQLWRGLVREGEDNVSNGPKLHPCQKPIELMRWCVSLTRQPIILDPYMGSGTTLRAAKDLNRQAIGIEIEERYCEIAAKRLAQGALPLGEAS